MAFTPEARAKALAARKANAAERRKAKKQHVEIASLGDASPADIKKLLAENAILKEQLSAAYKARSDVEKQALEAAQAQGTLMQREIEERPTGKTVTLKQLDHYKVVGHKDDGREIIKPVFKEVDVPTFFYKIDMPPCGGTDLKINGDPFYHGAVYELDIHSLRTVKDIVYRTWKHDADIHGSDENFYRKPTHQRISARAAR